MLVARANNVWSDGLNCGAELMAVSDHTAHKVDIREDDMVFGCFIRHDRHRVGFRQMGGLQGCCFVLCTSVATASAGVVGVRVIGST